MSTELLEKKYDQLFHLVTKLRHYQNRYLKFRIGSDLKNAKRYGRTVDKVIENEMMERASLQKPLL